MVHRLLTAGLLCALAHIAHADLLPANIDLANGPGDIGTPATFFTAPANTAAGAGNQSVAVGDFNRDGFDDMAVGYSASDFSANNAGLAYVIFGRADFPNEQNAATNPVTFLYCQDEAAQFGAAVATGDLDGDGRDELLIGAPGFDGGRGAVAIFNGSALVANGSLGISFAANDPTGTEMRILGTEAAAQFGYSITTGNLDQDDRWDVAVGEPYADSGAKVDTGKCYAWFGDDYAPSTKINATAINNRWMIIGGEGDNVGSALAMANGDPDGLDNLAIGAIGYGSSSRVYYMNTLNPATTDYELDDGNFTNHGALDGVQGLGFALAAASVNSNSREGLLLGAPLYDRESKTNSGAVIFLEDLQAIIGGTTTLDISSNINGALIFLGANDNALFGAALAFNDLNGDGRLDFVIGEPAGPGAEGQTQAGRAHVFYSDGSLITGNTYDLDSAPLSITITGQAALGYFGASLADNFDANGDGVADLFTQAPFAVQGADGLGNAYLLYGGRDESITFATSRLELSPGDTPTLGFGGQLSPVLRTKVKFNGGSAAPAYVEIYPGQPASGLTGDNDNGTADQNTAKVNWTFQHSRTNVTSIEVTLNYTDAEIADFNEDFLGVYLSDGCGAPWGRILGQTHDPASNEFKFTLVGEYPDFCLGIAYEAPIITLLGNNGIELNCGTQEYTDAGAAAQSVIDGDISQNIVVDLGGLDTGTPGEYTITYNVTDSTGAAAVEVTRTVTVVDEIKPNIFLTSQPSLSCGDTYTEAGYTAIDDCEGDLTAQVIVSGDTVDTTTPGLYNVLYTVTDSAGNTQEKTRGVLVQTPSIPQITINSSNPIIWECGVPFVAPSATAIDLCGNDYSAQITLDTPLPPAVPTADFALNYKLTVGDVTRTASRTVDVVDTIPPVITLIGDADITIPCGLPYNDAGATMIDSCNGDITFARLQTQNLVNEDVPGTYDVVYFGTDTAFNPAVQVTRTVTVVCPQDEPHTVDQDGNFIISLSELLRPIQFYNAGGLHCADNPNETEDGYVSGPGANQTCAPYASDYNPQNWIISLSELLRAIQFYNTGAYYACPDQSTEDDYCPGTP